LIPAPLGFIHATLSIEDRSMSDVGVLLICVIVAGLTIALMEMCERLMRASR
jgi:hypothetical protein